MRLQSNTPNRFADRSLTLFSLGGAHIITNENVRNLYNRCRYHTRCRVSHRVVLHSSRAFCASIIDLLRLLARLVLCVVRKPPLSRKQPQGIARRHELSLNDSMKLIVLILLLSVSVAASKEIPNKSLTLTWDASPISNKVTGYRVYELVKSRRVLIGQSNTPHFVTPRKKGKHVYVVTAVSAKGESAPSAPLQVQN